MKYEILFLNGYSFAMKVFAFTFFIISYITRYLITLSLDPSLQAKVVVVFLVLLRGEWPSSCVQVSMKDICYSLRLISSALYACGGDICE